MIEVISEKNADWWLGRARGKEGLFPSNYVEKVDSAALAPAPVMTVTATQGKPYRPFGAALHGTDAPPPNGVGVNSLGLQQASGQADKKNKYGALGNTVIDVRTCKVISANQTCRWRSLLRVVLVLVLVGHLLWLILTWI